MLSFELLRISKDLTNPQRGILILDGEPLLASLELPWKNNQQQVSCIPEGEYSCNRVLNRTTTGGSHLNVTFEVKDVPGRSGILFHPGNTVEDTKGCILLGESFDSWGNIFAIIHSRTGFKKFINLVGKEEQISLKVSHV